MAASHFILYVADQARSTAFYAKVLGLAPRLHLPGMTEFALPGGGILGLMPEEGIRRLLGDALPDPAAARGFPRAELYLLLAEPAAYHARAIAAGARELSPLLPRAWGHVAAYSIDADGHVLAFAADTIGPKPVTPGIDKLAWLHCRDKRVLCARSKGKSTWYLPGGKREPGESDAAALIREIREELSVELLPRSLQYANTFCAEADGKPAGTILRMTCYHAEFLGEITAAAEIEEIAWLTHRDREHGSAALKLVLDWLKEKDLIA